eukprot:1281881-Pleurochrysis_carterae.AAC.1
MAGGDADFDLHGDDDEADLEVFQSAVGRGSGRDGGGESGGAVGEVGSAQRNRRIAAQWVGLKGSAAVHSGR